MIAVSVWKETCAHLNVAAVTDTNHVPRSLYGCLKR